MDFANFMFLCALINGVVSNVAPAGTAIAIVCAIVGASSQISTAIKDSSNA